MSVHSPNSGLIFTTPRQIFDTICNCLLLSSASMRLGKYNRVIVFVVTGIFERDYDRVQINSESWEGGVNPEID